MIFGAHADILPSLCRNKASSDTGFCDDFNGHPSGFSSLQRSGDNNNTNGGINYIHADSTGSSYSKLFGARIMYNGDESTVHIIDDATEEL